jgi:branched-chain amino acid transport system permease protein
MDRPCGSFDENYRQDSAIIRTRTQWGWLVAFLILLATLPFITSAQILSTLNFIGITLIAVHGLNLLTGYAGQISLGQAAFVAVGGYTTALLNIHAGFSFWAALPVSALAAGIVGLIFGLPSLRLKGFYLAMATLAAQFIIPWCIVNIRPDITGGTSALIVPAPRLGGIVFNSQQSMFYIIMPMAVLVTIFVKNLVRTKVGRAFIAIRDNDIAAEIMGVNIFRYKMLAFFLCSLLAGIAGSLWVSWLRAVDADYFTLQESIWFLGMVVIGGMGSTAGAVMGVTSVRFMDLGVKTAANRLGELYPSAATGIFAGLGPFLFGFIILIFLIFEPHGLMHRWVLLKNSYRLWPFSRY